MSTREVVLSCKIKSLCLVLTVCDGVFYLRFQTLRQEKRIKNMGAAQPGFTHTVLLLGGGECEQLPVSVC